jgi:putative transcriptional regulator
MKNILINLTRLTTAPDYTPDAIKKVIEYLRLNEKGFALLMNVTPITVKLWTTGISKPCGVSRRLMQVYEQCPEAVVHIAGGDGN